MSTSMSYNHCLVMLDMRKKKKKRKQIYTVKKVTDYNSQLQLIDIIFTDVPGRVPIT